MIDYDKPDDDPIVAEVRRAREELAAQFNYDLSAIFKEMRRRQDLHPEKYASLEPRKKMPKDAPPSDKTVDIKPKKRAV